jgi:hypothetical protein
VIEWREAAWHAVHRGVYAVGHCVLSPEGRWMAAVLAGGSGAALSHRSAAALWGLGPSLRGLTEVTVERQRWPRRGIEMHRGSLPSDELTASRGIPVTTVARTLLDLAAVLSRRQVERAVHEAEARRLGDSLSLQGLVARHPRGVATIEAILASGRIGSTVTRSELESRFVGFLDAAGLPRPEVNASLPVAGRWVEADCVWREQRLIIELDAHAFHATSAHTSATVPVTGLFTLAGGGWCGSLGANCTRTRMRWRPTYVACWAARCGCARARAVGRGAHGRAPLRS